MHRIPTGRRHGHLVLGKYGAYLVDPKRRHFACKMMTLDCGNMGRGAWLLAR